MTCLITSPLLTREHKNLLAQKEILLVPNDWMALFFEPWIWWKLNVWFLLLEKLKNITSRLPFWLCFPQFQPWQIIVEFENKQQLPNKILNLQLQTRIAKSVSYSLGLLMSWAPWNLSIVGNWSSDVSQECLHTLWTTHQDKVLSTTLITFSWTGILFQINKWMWRNCSECRTSAQIHSLILLELVFLFPFFF